MHGTTSVILSLSVSVNSKSLLDHIPCFFAYSSTRFMVSLLRPENFKYLIVSSSIGKNPQVAPYSGAMLPIVALSASDKFFNPDP